MKTERQPLQPQGEEMRWVLNGGGAGRSLRAAVIGWGPVGLLLAGLPIEMVASQMMTQKNKKLEDERDPRSEASGP